MAHAQYDWLTSRDKFVLRMCAIEFAATCLLMFLLFFSGAECWPGAEAESIACRVVCAKVRAFCGRFLCGKDR
ncbi:MAG: hypothetical protein ACRERX_21720 [Pseudomonas sp.]